MMEQTAVDANVLRDKLTELLRDEHYTLDGVARAMNLAPETLRAWYARTPGGDPARVERIVRDFFVTRDAFWTAIKNGDARACEDLKGTLILALSEAVSRLVREAGVSRNAELIEAQTHVILRDLELATKAAAGCTDVNCWRCGAGIWPPPSDLAGEIEKNVNLAMRAGWNAELFRLRAREKMTAGDRIVRLGNGAFVARRPDKTQFVVRRFDD